LEKFKGNKKVSERRICKALGVNRNTLRYETKKGEKDAEIREKVIATVKEYGRVGYRMVTNILRNQGFLVNHKRVERIWREEGLKLPKKQRKRRRLWLNDGSCLRLRAEQPNHVWSYDFVEDKTQNGRKIRILNIIDEFTHECLASVPRRSWKNTAVMEVLADLFFKKGMPEYLRSDNGSEFSNNQIKAWLAKMGVITAFIEPGSPWENGFCESFNSRMRDEFLNGDIFETLKECEVLLSRWVRYYNEIRPHSSLGGKPPMYYIKAPECWTKPA